jgi:polysaccharide export outer membrane protein
MLVAGCVAAYGQAAPNVQQATNRIDSPSGLSPAPPADLRTTYPPEAASKEYKIGINDVLTINVWHEPDLSRNLTVRPDGRISLPLVGDVRAAGKTPPQLEAELKSDLAEFIKDPELTVIVAEIRSRRVNVIGQVSHPGSFALTQQMGVLDIIAEAGGLRDFAKKKKIYVLRETAAGVRERIHYDYNAVLAARHNAQDIILQANDTVVVP